MHFSKRKWSAIALTWAGTVTLAVAPTAGVAHLLTKPAQGPASVVAAVPASRPFKGIAYFKVPGSGRWRAVKFELWIVWKNLDRR